MSAASSTRAREAQPTLRPASHKQPAGESSGHIGHYAHHKRPSALPISHAVMCSQHRYHRIGDQGESPACAKGWHQPPSTVKVCAVIASGKRICNTGALQARHKRVSENQKAPERTRIPGPFILRRDPLAISGPGTPYLNLPLRLLQVHYQVDDVWHRPLYDRHSTILWPDLKVEPLAGHQRGRVIEST